MTEEQKQAKRAAAKVYYEANKEKIKQYSMDWRRKNPDKRREYSKKARSKEAYKKYSVEWRLLKRHSITLEQYNQILKDQGGGCAICGKTNQNGRALAVDHNHITNENRGLLCDNHNTGLGLFKDNIEELQRAINYLKEHAV